MNHPIAVTGRMLLALVLAAAVLSAGVAVAAAQLSQPQTADAAASDRAVVKQLKALRKEFRAQLGNPANGDVKDKLEKICFNLGSAQGQFGGGGVSCQP